MSRTKSNKPSPGFSPGRRDGKRHARKVANFISKEGRYAPNSNRQPVCDAKGGERKCEGNHAWLKARII